MQSDRVKAIAVQLLSIWYGDEYSREEYARLWPEHQRNRFEAAIARLMPEKPDPQPSILRQP